MIKVGTIVGDRYEVLQKIGSGGMAEVYKGKDHKLNRYVAVKVLREEFRENESFVRKFKEEAQAAASLAHPNIVNVYDVGDENGIYYIVMELVEGITLKNYIERKGRLTIKEATSIAIQVSAGLSIAHSNHIVHRDIKPQNIIISREGKVKVTDFGIAKAASSQTTTSTVMGSVHYASPEQARGGYVDHRSDIYSLGIVLYEMVTGRVPFDGDTAVAVAVKHLQETITPPNTYCREIPRSLEQIILKCTEKSPDRRYQDIEDLLADLKQSLMDPEGDFVQKIDVDQNARTVVMNKKTVSAVKASRKAVHVEEEEEEDEDEEEYDDEDDDDEDDEELSPAVERVMTIAGVALAIIIVIILLMLAARVLGLGRSGGDDSDEDQQTEELQDGDEEGDGDSETNTVEMPSLIGMTMTEAKIELGNIGLSVTLKGSRDSSEYAAGQIIEQSVEPGERVEVESTIDVVIAGSGSQGSAAETQKPEEQEEKEEKEELVKVPDVRNQTEANAKTALTAANLNVGTVTESASDTVKSGNVVSQSQEANKEVPKGTTVNLVISSGPQKVQVTDVIGHEQSRAEGELRGAGFEVVVNTENSDSIREGLVIRTNPDRGTYVEPGSKVTMTVSAGKPQIRIPTVSTGMTPDAAEKALRDAGFTGSIKSASEPSDAVGQGFVTRYSPSGSVDADGTVTIYVSTGSE